MPAVPRRSRWYAVLMTISFVGILLLVSSVVLAVLSHQASIRGDERREEHLWTPRTDLHDLVLLRNDPHGFLSVGDDGLPVFGELADFLVLHSQAGTLVHARTGWFATLERGETDSVQRLAFREAPGPHVFRVSVRGRGECFLRANKDDDAWWLSASGTFGPMRPKSAPFGATFRTVGINPPLPETTG